jgi:hypothetical protein
MLGQEIQIWDSKRTKEKNRFRDGPDILLRLVKQVNKEIDRQLGRAPQRNVSRAKRELQAAKQLELIEDFHTEEAALSMTFHDGESSVQRYHDIRIFQISTAIRLIVPPEMQASTQLNKFEQRLTGYTKSLVQTLHERDESVLIGNARGCRLWALHTSIANIVGRKSSVEAIRWPQSASLVEVLLTLELIEQQVSARPPPCHVHCFV